MDRTEKKLSLLQLSSGLVMGPSGVATLVSEAAVCIAEAVLGAADSDSERLSPQEVELATALLKYQLEATRDAMKSCSKERYPVLAHLASELRAVIDAFGAKRD